MLNCMHQNWIPTGAVNITAALTVKNIPGGFSESVESGSVSLVGVEPPKPTLATTDDFLVIKTTTY